MKRTHLTIVVASAYIFGVISFFTGYIATLAAIVFISLIILLWKDIITGKKALFACLFFVVAIINCNLQIKDCDDLCKYAQNGISLTGTVVTIPTTNLDDRTKFYFVPNSGVFKGEKLENLKAQSIVTIYGKKETLSDIKIGDKVEISGFLTIPQESKNPAQFDYRNYLKNHKTFTTMYVKDGNWHVISASDKFVWKFLRKLNNKRMDILKIHQKFMKSPNLEVLGGIVFGDDAINPPDYIRSSFINSGLLHILAASGMNVSIIFGMWYFIASRLRVNYRFIIIFGALLVALYTLMTGMGPSVLRAALMIELVLLGKLFDRDADSFSLIFFVALALLLYNPAMINDIGFQLSFIVTFALMFYCPPILEKINNKFLDFVVGAVLIPVVAQFWAAPIQMYYFNTFATYSVLANFLISPLIAVISFIGFLGSTLALIPFIADKVCRVFDFVLNPFVSLLIGISDFVSAMPYSLLTVSNPSIFRCLIYFSFLITIGFCIRHGFKNKKLISIMMICVLIFSFSFVKINDRKCKVIVFSVGNADSFLIKTPENNYIMIDTALGALKEHGFSVANSVMVKYLKNNGIRKIDSVILTHYDSDHVGGTIDIMENVRVGTLYLNEYRKNTDTELKLLRYIKENNINNVVANNNKVIYQEGDFIIKTFVPDIKTGKNISNDTSTIVLLSYKDFDMLFMADGGIDSYNKVKSYLPADMEVIKTGHHGALYTVDDEMLKHGNFDTAIISTGRNQYGHPTYNTINTIITNGLQLYRTDVNNAVEVVSDGQSYDISLYNPSSSRFNKVYASKS